MTPNQIQDPNEEAMQNLIRQKRLESAFGNAGIPQSTDQASSREPDVFHHVQHTFDAPSSPQSAQSPSQSQGQLDQNQEAAMNQTGVPPSPSVPTPIPKVGPIDPNTAKPAESAYLQSLQNEPMHANYHPSGMRKAMSIIGGMGVGAFYGPQAGSDVMQGIRNQPFNQQHSDWKQFAQNKGIQATEEAANDTTTGKAATDASLIAERNSVAAKNIRETGNMAPDMATDVQNKKDIRQAGLKVDTREAKMLDGTIKHVIQKNGIFYDPTTHAVIPREMMDDISDEGKSLRETKASRIPGNLGESVKAKQIIAEGVGGPNKYDQATVDAATEYDKHLSDGKEAAAGEAGIVNTRNKERKAKGQQEMSSKERQDLHERLLMMQKPPQALMEDPNTHVAFAAKPGTAIPQGSTTPQQAGANAAKDSKEQEDMQADKRFVNDYLTNQTHTGPGDEALLERFFNATKPSTGFKMNQAQIALLTRLRSFSSSAKAFMAHATGGTLFDDKQRGEIVDAINKVIDSKSKGSSGVEEYIRDPKTNKLVLKK